MKAPGARGRGGCAGLGEGEGVLASLQTKCVCGACRAMHLGAPAGPSEGRRPRSRVEVVGPFESRCVTGGLGSRSEGQEHQPPPSRLTRRALLPVT